MRITGGVHRSRALRAPRGSATRPTSDRVREAIFSMLAADGVLSSDEGRAGRAERVLDLFAGSGALAFEALSRGAAEAVLVEEAPAALAAIRENARALGLEESVRVVAGRLPRALERLAGAFDVVFVDPPYAAVADARFRALLDSVAPRLAPAGVLVLEHAATDAPPQAHGLAFDRSRRYGDTAVSLFRRSDQSA